MAPFVTRDTVQWGVSCWCLIWDTWASEQHVLGKRHAKKLAYVLGDSDAQSQSDAQSNWGSANSSSGWNK
eukprot:11183276-Lingulodinium_polyedra.AAC.1